MTNIKDIVEELFHCLNITPSRVEFNAEGNHLAVFIDEDYLVKKNLPQLVSGFNHISQLISRKTKSPFVCVDINNYRLERERLITELAKAAARKVLMTNQEVALPVMNSYERRLIHTELAMRPDIKTESQGAGRTRHVIVKPLAE